jgi:single-stranded-DNA-specific exonuclease
LLVAAAVTADQQQRLRNVLLPSFLKLVAIATIADSVELTGENRAIVWLGLRELRNPVQPGLRALMRVAELPLDRAPTANEVGFRIAPRINAAGRMDVASDVVELFLTRDSERANQLAEKLDRLNQERRATEATALEAIDLQLEAMRSEAGAYPPECIVLDHPEWHRGVLGILASRVVDRTGLPALILTWDEEAAHGSGRSIDGYHLLDALTQVHEEGLFTRFGGHAYAVGFSLPHGNIAELRARMQVHSRSLLQGAIAPRIVCDVELTQADLSLELMRWLRCCAPFGMGAREPVFVARELVLSGNPRVIKEKHVCLPLGLTPGLTGERRELSALGWSRPGQAAWASRIEPLGLGPGSKIDVVCRLRENTHPQYGGLELELIDLRAGEESAVGITAAPQGMQL